MKSRIIFLKYQTHTHLQVSDIFWFIIIEIVDCWKSFISNNNNNNSAAILRDRLFTRERGCFLASRKEENLKIYWLTILWYSLHLEEDKKKEEKNKCEEVSSKTVKNLYKIRRIIIARYHTEEEVCPRILSGRPSSRLPITSIKIRALWTTNLWPITVCIYHSFS